MSMITTAQLPFFSKLVETASSLDATFFIVGGTVRDIILGRAISDIDIVTFGVDYELFAKKFSRKANAYRVPFKDNVRLAKGDIIMDISKPRGNDIYEDLQKRDFTINNLALDMDGNIIGDRADIDNNIIKSVHDDSLTDDALRILRAYRFSAQLGFGIDSDTLQLMTSALPLLQDIAIERIREELMKTILSAHAQKVIHDNDWINTLSSIGIYVEQDSLARLVSYEFPSSKDLLLSIIATSDKATEMHKTLQLAQNDLSTITNLKNSLAEFMEKDFTDEREQRLFAWKYRKSLQLCISFIKAINPELSLLVDSVASSHDTLNHKNASKINGAVLMQNGFSPSPMFSVIIDDVSQRLALNELAPKDIVSYINDKYKG